MCALSVAFTGHRPESLPCGSDMDSDVYFHLQTLVWKEIIRYIDAGCKTFYCGAARGADIMCGEIILAEKATGHADVQLICAIPFNEQARSWEDSWKMRYYDLLRDPDRIKVNPAFYNAFYELFDEGRFVDSNYDVQLRNTIFICTCNFMNESEIKKTLGPAMFSRIGCCIKFEDISVEQKCVIIEKWYTQILEKLLEDEQAHIASTDILEWFKNNANRYDNIRILKGKLENAIFDELTCRFVINDSDQ